MRISNLTFISYHHCCAVHMGNWMNGYGNMMNELTGSGKLLLSGKIMTLYDRPLIRQECCGNRILFTLCLSGDDSSWRSGQALER